MCRGAGWEGGRGDSIGSAIFLSRIVSLVWLGSINYRIMSSLLDLVVVEAPE